MQVVIYSHCSFVVQVVNHPSKVIEIQMKKVGFHHEAGQVCLVICTSFNENLILSNHSVSLFETRLER